MNHLHGARSAQRGDGGRNGHAKDNGRRNPARHGQNERTMKLTKKNALFAGSDDGARTWARCASLIGTCKLNGVNPQVYLTDTLRRIIDMHPVSRIDELMPWNFAPTIPGVTRQQG